MTFKSVNITSDLILALEADKRLSESFIVDFVSKLSLWQDFEKRFFPSKGSFLPLLTSFIHSSFVHEAGFKFQNNEKLEFLGDSILNFMVSEEIYSKFPNISEGQLSKLRASLVNEEILSKISHSLNLGYFVLLGNGELQGKGFERKAVLADTFEALIGGLYFFYGFEKVKVIFKKFIEHFEKEFGETYYDEKRIECFDIKSKFQEKVQKAYKVSPTYETKKIKENLYQTTLKIKNKKILMKEGSSKKEIEKSLAKEAFEQGLY